MSEWLLGIVGIICLGLLLEIVLPDGQTTKYVRGAFSLLVIFVVIAPLPKLFGGDYTVVFDGVDYDIDTDFVHTQAINYTSSLEEDLEKILESEGYEARVEIVTKEGSVRDFELITAKIFLSLIDENEEHTYISQVTGIIAKYLSVSKDKIKVGVEYGSG